MWLLRDLFVLNKLNKMKLKIDEELNFVKVLNFDKVCPVKIINPTGFQNLSGLIVILRLDI